MQDGLNEFRYSCGVFVIKFQDTSCHAAIDAVGACERGILRRPLQKGHAVLTRRSARKCIAMHTHNIFEDFKNFTFGQAFIRRDCHLALHTRVNKKCSFYWLPIFIKIVSDPRKTFKRRRVLPESLAVRSTGFKFGDVRSTPLIDVITSPDLRPSSFRSIDPFFGVILKPERCNRNEPL